MLLCAVCKVDQSVASPGPHPQCEPASPATLDIVLHELRNGIAGINVRLEPLPALIEDVKDIKRRLNRYEKDMAEVKSEVNDFKIRTEVVETKVAQFALDIHAREQRDRLNNVEIKGLPAKKNENLIELTQKLGNHIGVSIDPANINFITRARSDSKYKPIIVGFTGRILKENFVAGAKSFKNLTAEDLGFSGITSRIFVNDHLTRENKQLLTKTKKVALEKNYQFTWVQNCKILVRKNETSPFIHVQCDEDLIKLK